MSKIRELYDNLSVSLKITAAFTFFFLVIIIAVVLVTGVCVSYALRHPAEATIQHTKEKVQEILEKNVGKPLDVEEIRKKIVPGVVLKIFDAQQNLIFDNGGDYHFTNEIFEKGILKNSWLMLNSEMEIANVNGALVLRTDMVSDVEGAPFTFYFFRTITSQKSIFDGLEEFVLAMIFLLLFFSASMYEMLNKTILSPIKKMTALAKKFSVADGDEIQERIPIPPANDELTDLAKTFNEMLDKIKRDFDDIQEVLSHKEKFVSTVYHDIKNPLTAIDTRLQLLALYGEDPEKLNSSITSIQNDLQDTFNLVENYRLFTQMTDENFNPSKRLLNLQEILFSIVESALEFEKNKNRIIRLKKNDFAQIYANKSLIVTMFRNFLGNAVKYSYEGGVIEISSEVDGENVIVKISDNGIGIAQKDIEKIFVYGYRAKEISAERKIDGSGIGLANSKMIADIHDIKIDVKSVVKKGTTFKLTIPTV